MYRLGYLDARLCFSMFGTDCITQRRRLPEKSVLDISWSLAVTDGGWFKTLRQAALEEVNFWRLRHDFKHFSANCSSSAAIAPVQRIGWRRRFAYANILPQVPRLEALGGANGARRCRNARSYSRYRTLTRVASDFKLAPDPYPPSFLRHPKFSMCRDLVGNIVTLRESYQ